MPNQFAVNAAMQYCTNALTAYTGTLGTNIATRSVVNFLGECADDAVALGSASYLTGREVETQVRFSLPSTHTWNEVADKILTDHAGRRAFFHRCSAPLIPAISLRRLVPGIAISHWR